MRKRLGLLCLLPFCALPAFAQVNPGAVAEAERAIHCSEALVIADQMVGFGLIPPGQAGFADSTLDGLEARYDSRVDEISRAAGYTPEMQRARAAAHRTALDALDYRPFHAKVMACAFGFQLPNLDSSDPPKTGLQLAQAGRGANDVLFVDMGSLDRMGPVVSGWQLYVFRTDQNVVNQPSKASWTRFYIHCEQGTSTSYRTVGLSSVDSGAAFTGDSGGAPRAPVTIQPNTFGAATYMLACGVTIPTATLPGLAEAAASARGQFPPG